MSDEMIRRKLHAAADDCLSGVARMPSQKKAVFDRIERMEKGRTVRHAPRMAVVLAAVMTLMLASAAVAAGLGLFGMLRGGLEDEMNYNRLGLLEEAAITIGQTTAIRNYGELTIDQAYCDGQRLYYSYTIRKNDSLASLYLGDGAVLPDGTELPPVDSWIEEIDDFTTAAFYEVALPEDFNAAESVSILLSAIYHKDDGTLELIDVPARIPVTSPRQILTGEGVVDGFAAKAELRVTDVDVYGTVRITAPQGYSPEVNALYADGTMYPNLDWGETYADGVQEIALRFDLPKSLEYAKLILSDSEDGTIELK